MRTKRILRIRVCVCVFAYVRACVCVCKCVWQRVRERANLCFQTSGVPVFPGSSEMQKKMEIRERASGAGEWKSYPSDQVQFPPRPDGLNIYPYLSVFNGIYRYLSVLVRTYPYLSVLIRIYPYLSVFIRNIWNRDLRPNEKEMIPFPLFQDLWI